MDFFKIINDIAAETRMNMGEKVRLLIRILVGISPKRIECHRRAGPPAGGYPGEKSLSPGPDGSVEAGSCAGKMKTAGPEPTRPHDIP